MEDCPGRSVTCAPSEFDVLVNELIGRGHGFRLSVSGSSMFPSIRDGDIVVVEPCDSRDLRLGDIVFYRRPRGHTAHRLVGRCDGGANLITRGDALAPCDPVLSRSQVVGRVVVVERGDRSYRAGTLCWRFQALARVLTWRWRDRRRGRGLRRLLDRLG